MEAKNEKSKTTLFSQTFEVAENKVPLFFFIFSLLAEILAIGAFYQYLHLAEVTWKWSPCSLKIALPFLK